MYILLTSKEGQYRTELRDGLVATEIYDYVFHGKPRLRVVIAQLSEPVKIPVVDEEPPGVTNLVPSKFFPRFDDLDSARRALAELADFGQCDTRLVKIDSTSLIG